MSEWRLRSRICESCLRYNQTPIWGHTLCSAHRICCRDDKVWKPGDCDTCLEQQDKLDLASNKVREASFREMLKMLICTKSSKGLMVQKIGNMRMKWVKLSDYIMLAQIAQTD